MDEYDDAIMVDLNQEEPEDSVLILDEDGSEHKPTTPCLFPDDMAYDAHVDLVH